MKSIEATSEAPTTTMVTVTRPVALPIEHDLLGQLLKFVCKLANGARSVKVRLVDCADRAVQLIDELLDTPQMAKGYLLTLFGAELLHSLGIEEEMTMAAFVAST